MSMSDQSVLIVDDDPRICRLIKRVAINMGFRCDTVEDSDHFFNRYLEFRPSIILLDLKMKGVDGVELLRHLASIDSESQIIIMSGVDSRVLDTTRRLGKSLGLHMAGVLPKPIDIKHIEEVLSKQYQRFSAGKGVDKKVSISDLEAAIRHQHINVYYQAQVCLKTGRLTGVEALCRWFHPSLGEIPPDIFIPMAEKFRLIKPLTETVLNTAISDLPKLLQLNDNLTTSINLSALLLSDLQIPDTIEQILKAKQVPAHNLSVEITESAAMEDPSRTMEILTRLRIKDIQVSMDDFGTGYSSLVQLYRLPFGELKIDKSFVMDMLHSDEAAAIVKSTINIGQTLGLTIVAEGVENAKTFKMLQELNCDYAQGYYIAHALPLNQFLQWYQRHLKSA